MTNIRISGVISRETVERDLRRLLLDMETIRRDAMQVNDAFTTEGKAAPFSRTQLAVLEEADAALTRVDMAWFQADAVYECIECGDDMTANVSRCDACITAEDEQDRISEMVRLNGEDFDYQRELD